MISQIQNSKISFELNYPKLMTDEKQTVVLLMTEHETGTVVMTKNKNYVLGDHSTDWVMRDLKDLHRSTIVQLKND